MNLTQDFTFETSSLESFATMLGAAIPVVFLDSERSDEHPRCTIINDPSEIGRSPESGYPSESAAWYLEYRKMTLEEWKKRTGAKSLFWPVCQLIGGDSGTHSVADAVRETVARLERSDATQLVKNCGGHEGPFVNCTGSVKRGYRMHLSKSRGMILFVSLCHIYYPK